MAVIRIMESDDTGARGTVRRAPFSVIQTPVAIGAASVASSAFGPSTRILTVQADAACHIAFGKTPVATTSGFKMAADSTEDFEVNGGDKIAVVQA